MSLINLGSDPWLIEYDACEKLSREILEQLNARDGERPTSSQHDLISAKIRVRLKQFTTELTQLNNKLRQASVVSTITTEERERRQRQIDQLRSRMFQLEQQFNSITIQGAKNVVVDMKTTGWGGDDDEDESQNIQNMPTSSLRTQQQQMLQEQDEGLDNLSKVIARQKKIATVISGEVDDQNEILDDIATNMDRVDTRIRGETDMIRTIDRKDSTWGYWVVIILLLITIVAVGFA